MMAKQMEGIVVRHGRACPSHTGGKCAKPCAPSYQAWVWDRREGKKIKRSFPTLAAARNWRSDALGGVRRGTMRATAPTTLSDAWEAWRTGADDGTVRTRSGDVYKPSALRGYEQAMRLRVLPE